MALRLVLPIARLLPLLIVLQILNALPELPTTAQPLQVLLYHSVLLQELLAYLLKPDGAAPSTLILALLTLIIVF